MSVVRDRSPHEAARTSACVVLATIVMLAVAACAGPTASENFYALNDGAVVVSAAPKPAPAAGPRIASLPGIVVSAVTIPELIDRPQIVTRDASNRVIVSEQNLWAESIRSGVARTLAARIARVLDDAGQAVQTGAYPQTSIADPVLRITVDIVRFDAVPNGEAVVDATWSIRRPADEYIRTGRTVAASPIAGTGYEAIVRGWNDAVAIMDRDVAAAVLDVGLAPSGTAARPAVPAAASVTAPGAAPVTTPTPRRVPRAKSPVAATPG